MWFALKVDMQFDLMSVWLVVCTSGGLVLGAGGRHKRIINGDTLTGHGDYNTNYMVSVRDSWGCEMSKDKGHNSAHCEGITRCGGVLITPEFAVTACHCMLYEDYRVIFAVPHATNASETYPDKQQEQEEELWRTIQVRGVLTTILIDEPFRSMSLWMGSVINDWTAPSQSRSVRIFYPHSKCSLRLPRFLGYVTARYTTGTDIGLIRPWTPFELNHDVGVAWIYKNEHLVEQYLNVRRKQMSCLFLGFGKTDETQREAYVLNYMFGHITCVTDCPNPTEDCAICSTYVGPNVKGHTETDSGGPVVCNRWLFGITSSGVYKTSTNSSLYRIAPILCIKDFITDEHLAKLKLLGDNYYKWKNSSYAGGWARFSWYIRGAGTGSFSAEIGTSSARTIAPLSLLLLLVFLNSPQLS